MNAFQFNFQLLRVNIGNEMELLHILAYFLIALCSLIYLFLHQRFSYWASRGVVHDKPVLLYGNVRQVGRTQQLRQPFRDFYEKYKRQASFGGFYLFMRPAAVLFDLELVKSVLIKDFDNFAHRGNYYNERDDPLSAHLFNLDGPKWRKLRNKMTPTFTSSKMKFMLPTVIQVAEHLIEVLRRDLGGESSPPSGVYIEIKDLLERFTTDVIGNCAFGLECNSLNDPQAQFRLMARKAFSVRRHSRLIFSVIQAFPELARRFGVKREHEDVHQFFMRVVKETVEYRERTQVQRKDFMNLLLELKKNKGEGGLTVGEIAAEALVFLVAGFETSSRTMGFCLYELAVNTAIQERARAEIIAMLEKHNSVFTYECMYELKYLLQIIRETLRLYSVSPIVYRKAVNNYPVPNTNHVIEKGIMVIIPIDAIHHDPDIYADPEVFNPDNFTPAEMEKRNSVAWLPFGEGPRNCIGMRFGEMQMLVGLALLLKHFCFSLAPQMPIPLKINIKDFALSSEGGLFLKVEPI